MCDLISWLEKDGDVLFLTADQVFNTKRGRELRDYSGSDDDLYGHGSIEWFYDIKTKGYIHKECTVLLSPANFPAQISDAIKNGEYFGFGVNAFLCLLKKSALVEYKKIRQTALVEYEKIRQTALVEYKKIRQTALVEYEKIRQPALAEYEKIEQTAFRRIFANPKNRIPAWR